MLYIASMETITTAAVTVMNTSDWPRCLRSAVKAFLRAAVTAPFPW